MAAMRKWTALPPVTDSSARKLLARERRRGPRVAVELPGLLAGEPFGVIPFRSFRCQLSNPPRFLYVDDRLYQLACALLSFDAASWGGPNRPIFLHRGRRIAGLLMGLQLEARL